MIEGAAFNQFLPADADLLPWCQKMPTGGKSTVRVGFTLIELLVVIAIISAGRKGSREGDGVSE